jgi:hypothetical protein
MKKTICSSLHYKSSCQQEIKKGLPPEAPDLVMDEAAERVPIQVAELERARGQGGKRATAKLT